MSGGKGVKKDHIPTIDSISATLNAEPLNAGNLNPAEAEALELEKKIEVVDAELEMLFSSFSVEELLRDGGLYEKESATGESILASLITRWDDVIANFDNGERSAELLNKYDSCKKDLEELLRDVKFQRGEKKINDELLRKNNGWQERFKKASEAVAEFGGTEDEFIKKYNFNVNYKNENTVNFDFNLKEKLLEYAEMDDTSINLEMTNNWRKVLGASKMINSKYLPKTVVVFENVSYVIDADKRADIKIDSKARNLAVEAINKIVKLKLQEKFSGSVNVCGNKWKDADFRYMAFIVGKEVMADEDVLKGFSKAGNNAKLQSEDEKKIDKGIADLLDAGGAGASELALKTYVYNEIGKTPEIKALEGKEKYSTPFDLVDGALVSFGDELNAKLKKFIEKRKTEKTSKLEDSQVIQIKKAIGEYVTANAPVIKTGEDAGLVAGEEKTEDAPEPVNENVESVLALGDEKSQMIDDLLASFHGLIDEIDKIDKKKENTKELADFADKVNAFLHELHDGEFTDELKEKSIKIKEEIEKEIIAISTSKKSKEEKANTPESLINEENQLEIGKAISKKLFNSWQKLPDFERESPDFEGIYRVVDLFEDKYFESELERINSNEKIDEEEKKRRIKQTLVRLQVMNKMVEEKLIEKFGNNANPDMKSDSLVDQNEKIEQDIKQQKIDALKWELGDARKEYNNTVISKSKEYKEVLDGLGNNDKSKYDTLMADDGDIAFYRKIYQQNMEQYLMTYLENANIELDKSAHRMETADSKPGWFKGRVEKSKSFFKGFAPKALKEKMSKVSLSEIKNKFSAEKVPEKKFEMGFEYVGGYDGLRKDLVVVMGMIISTERNIINADPKNKQVELLRDIKMKVLLSDLEEDGGKKKSHFEKLPIVAQMLIGKMLKTRKFLPEHGDLTLRDFIKNVLLFVKTNNQK